MTDYSSGQVTAALLQLVANQGNVRKTSEQLLEDEFMVPESTLRAWKNDTHREQYQRLVVEHGQEREAEAVNLNRSTMLRAADLESRVLDSIETKLDDGKIDTRDLPTVLRALTDTKAKSTDRLLALTGRPVKPTDPAGGDFVAMLQGMAGKGLIRLVVGLETGVAAPAAPLLHELQEQGGDGDDDAGDRGAGADSRD